VIASPNLEIRLTVLMLGRRAPIGAFRLRFLNWNFG
jgi:hypothetical protein